MKEVSIKVTIAGRVYPITVKPEEEKSIIKAALIVNNRIKEYGENYAVRDKQDLLAMCALLLASQNMIAENKTNLEEDRVASQLAEIETYVSNYLKKETIEVVG